MLAKRRRKEATLQEVLEKTREGRACLPTQLSDHPHPSCFEVWLQKNSPAAKLTINLSQGGDSL